MWQGGGRVNSFSSTNSLFSSAFLKRNKGVFLQCLSLCRYSTVQHSESLTDLVHIERHGDANITDLWSMEIVVDQTFSREE